MRYRPDLIPTELWAYDARDVVRGLRAALFASAPFDSLSLPDLGECVSVRSGRAGIVLAVRALDLPPDARIGVPLYCCPVVFKAIAAAGCVPRFVDIDPATLCVSVHDVAEKRRTI